MKHYLMAFALLLSLTVGMMACKPKQVEPDQPTIKENIVLKSVSITPDSYVNPATSEIILDYSPVNVKVDSRFPITLNGAAISATRNGTKVTLNVALEKDVEYTIIVPSKAIRAFLDSTRTAPRYELKFTTKQGDKPTPAIDPCQLIKTLGFGWNLGNHFDSGDKDFDLNGAQGYRWGYWDKAKPTEALYTNLAAVGVKTVRMPVTWGNWQVKEGYTIDADFMAEVKQNVDWAINAGLNVILNTHHDEYWQDAVNAINNPTLCAQIEDRIVKTWLQIANAYKDYNEQLLFETFNEIHDDNWGWTKGMNYNGLCQLMEKWNQLVVDSVRATGGTNATRWICVPSFCASPMFTDGTKHLLQIPNDPAKKIMVAVHSYDPFDFCTEGSVQQWGHTATEAGAAKNGEKNVEDLFNKLKAAFIDNGIPVYMGEFGCETRKNPADEKYRSYFMEYFCRAAYWAGIPVMLWDNNNNIQGKDDEDGGECFYYINHNNGQLYYEDLVKLMIKAATSEGENYTLESIYANAPQ